MSDPVLVIDKETGAAKVVDGKPVYRYEDGQEIPFDLGSTLKTHNEKVTNLEQEKTRHFTTAEKLKKDLLNFKGIDPEKAKSALETVKNLDSKQLYDANGVKALKMEFEEAAKEREKSIHEAYKGDIDSYNKKLSARDRAIYTMAVKSQFNESPWFTAVGDQQPKTNFLPQDAARIFGPNFKPELVENEKTGEIDIVTVAYDDNGNELVSRETQGGRPKFDEAIGILIEKRYGEGKVNIMRDPASTKRGPSSRSGIDNDNFSGKDRNAVISSGLEEARRSGKTVIQG